MSAIAVFFSGIGALLMFFVGAVSVAKSIGIYFGAGEDAAFSTEAVLHATVEIVTALDQFLLGLVLLVFAYGVYALFVVGSREEWKEETERLGGLDWLTVNSVTDLKVKLLEVIAVILAVLFLKAAISATGEFQWTELVLPISVLTLGATVWLIKRSHAGSQTTTGTG